MRIGDLAVVSYSKSKYRFAFPKQTGKINAVPVYPVDALSEEGILKPFLQTPLPTIQVGEIVMFLGGWKKDSSKSGLVRILYGNRVYAILRDCIELFDTNYGE